MCASAGLQLSSTSPMIHAQRAPGFWTLGYYPREPVCSLSIYLALSHSRFASPLHTHERAQQLQRIQQCDLAPLSLSIYSIHCPSLAPCISLCAPLSAEQNAELPSRIFIIQNHSTRDNHRVYTTLCCFFLSLLASENKRTLDMSFNAKLSKFQKENPTVQG